MSDSVRHDAKTPQVVIGEEEIFEAHLAAAEAIFSVASDDLAPDRIVPSPLDPRVGRAVASAVAAAAAEI